MSGGRDDSLLLGDLVHAAQRLVLLGKSIDESPLGSWTERDEQVLWNLTVLGEAAKRVSAATRERFADVPWSLMARLRDRVTHHYEGIDWYVVTVVVRDEIPALAQRLSRIRDTPEHQV